MRKVNGVSKALVIGCVAAAAGVGVFATTAQAIRPGGGFGCGRGIYCLDVWDPVICPNGVVYSNDCYAFKACQTGCVPYGGETQ